jgi:hypothetical protein
MQPRLMPPGRGSRIVHATCQDVSGSGGQLTGYCPFNKVSWRAFRSPSFAVSPIARRAVVSVAMRTASATRRACAQPSMLVTTADKVGGAAGGE